MDYRNLSRGELEAELARLERDLADLEETIGFHLMFTSAHVGGGQVRKDAARLDDLRRKIEDIRSVLEQDRV